MDEALLLKFLASSATVVVRFTKYASVQELKYLPLPIDVAVPHGSYHEHSILNGMTEHMTGFKMRKQHRNRRLSHLYAYHAQVLDI